MEIYLDCLPCLLRQALEAARLTNCSYETQQEILVESSKLLTDFTSYKSSPDIARAIHGIVKKYSGKPDPYEETKNKDFRFAIELLPHLRTVVSNKQDRLYWALKVSATGNIIDSAMNAGLNIEECIDRELNIDFARCDADLFKKQLETSGKNLLIIGDNSAETVFDRVLIEELIASGFDITDAVRSEPVINDSTIQDAIAAGIDQIARVISTGCNAPGTILAECSEEFLDRFYRSDIVISKGQGNFESLSDCDRNIYFLLKAKCVLVADLLGASLNDYVFEYYDPAI